MWKYQRSFCVRLQCDFTLFNGIWRTLREAAFVNKVGVSSCLTCCGVKWSRCGQQYSSSQKCTVYTGDKAIANQWPASFWTRKMYTTVQSAKAYTALQSQHNRKQWGIICSAAWQWLIRNCLFWVSVAGQTEEGLCSTSKECFISPMRSQD